MLNLLENRYARHRLPGATMTQAVADVLTLLDEVRRLRDGIAEHQSRWERAWSDTGSGDRDLWILIGDDDE